MDLSRARTSNPQATTIMVKVTQRTGPRQLMAVRAISDPSKSGIPNPSESSHSPLSTLHQLLSSNQLSVITSTLRRHKVRNEMWHQFARNCLLILQDLVVPPKNTLPPTGPSASGSTPAATGVLGVSQPGMPQRSSFDQSEAPRATFDTCKSLRLPM